MTAHELAKYLLTLPDLPVKINGWGSDEGLGPFEVTWAEKINVGLGGLESNGESYLALDYDSEPLNDE